MPILQRIVTAFSIFQTKIKAYFDRRRICSMRSARMSSDAFAYSNQAANGSRSPTTRGEVEQQSKETTSTPPSRVSKLQPSTNLDLFRLKRHRSNIHESAASPPIDRSSSAGPTLSNLDSLETNASISAKLELSNFPENKFILATPNQVSMEIQHPAAARPRAVYMLINDSTSKVHSNDEVFPEKRNGTISGMFLPVQAANGSHSPMDVEPQSKETTSTPPHSKHHSATNLDFFRLKRHRSNINESAASPADASISAKFEFSNVPDNTFILATPNQVTMEIQHRVVTRPRAVSTLRNDFSGTDSRVHSNDEILTENRHGSISGMFLPIYEGNLEGGFSQEEGTMMIGRHGLWLKPKKPTVRGDLFK
jgi:hypothetical protein